MKSGSQRYAELQFARGCNCAQAVLTHYAPALGLAPDVAMRIACGFGAGMRLGETCGAVTGAMMVLGLRHGNTTPADRDARQHTYNAIPAFAAAFRQRHGTTSCRELLQCDPATAEGAARARSQGLFLTRCTHYVASAVEILDDMASSSFSPADC